MRTVPSTHTRTGSIDITTVTALALSISNIRYRVVFAVCLTDRTIIDDDMRTISHMTITASAEFPYAGTSIAKYIDVKVVEEEAPVASVLSVPAL